MHLCIQYVQTGLQHSLRFIVIGFGEARKVLHLHFQSGRNCRDTDSVTRYPGGGDVQTGTSVSSRDEPGDGRRALEAARQLNWSFLSFIC